MAKKTDLTQKCRQLLVDHNIPITRPRIVLLEILLQNKGPLKVEDVIKLSEGKLAVSSLYRIINMLKNLDLISEFQTPDNTKVIELSGIKDDHHHQFTAGGRRHAATLVEQLSRRRCHLSSTR